MADDEWQRHVAIAIPVMRALALLDVYEGVAPGLSNVSDDDAQLELARMRPGAGQVGIAVVITALAYVHVAIEGWTARRRGLAGSDTRVDTLLADEPTVGGRSARAVLRDHRDAAFHPNELSDARHYGVVDNTELMLPWAVAVMSAMADYFRSYFARAAGRSTL